MPSRLPSLMSRKSIPANMGGNQNTQNRPGSPASMRRPHRLRAMAQAFTGAFRSSEKRKNRERLAGGRSNSTLLFDTETINLHSPIEEKPLGDLDLGDEFGAMTLEGAATEVIPPAPEADHAQAIDIVMARMNGIPDSYVIMLAESSDQKIHMEWLETVAKIHIGLCQVEFACEGMKGYSAKLSGDALTAVAKRSEVESIHQNQKRKKKRSGANQEVAPIESHEDAPRGSPWGLQRISNRNPIPPGSDPGKLAYIHQSQCTENPFPVDVYVIDSGVYIEHNDFGNRASWGYVVPGASKKDIDGHGTHIAAIIAGNQFGIAKNANIVALKDSDDNDHDNEPTNWTLACFNWVIKEAKYKMRRSVVNYSSNWNDCVELINIALRKTVRAGIPICASAGNDGEDASNDTPLCVPEVVIVGGTDIHDKRCSDSNYGPAVKIFAPGENIISAGIDGPFSQETKHGTSFASPHVAGVMAAILGQEKDPLTPAELFERVKNLALEGQLKDVGEGSPNLLLYNGAGEEKPPVEERTSLANDVGIGENKVEMLGVGLIHASGSQIGKVVIA